MIFKSVIAEKGYVSGRNHTLDPAFQSLTRIVVSSAMPLHGDGQPELVTASRQPATSS